MATNEQHNAVNNTANQTTNGTTTHDFEKATRGMSNEERQAAAHAARFGYGPLAHFRTNDDGGALPGVTYSTTWFLKASTD